MKTGNEIKIKNEIINQLKQKGFEVKENVVVGASAPDLFFRSPVNNTTYVVEVKNWDVTPSAIVRADKLSSMYASTAGTTNAYVILPNDFHFNPTSGSVSLSNFSALLQYINNQPQNSINNPPVVRPLPEKYIFVAIPSDEKFDDTFNLAIAPTALDLGVYAYRADREKKPGDIKQRIFERIENSIGVIADISGFNPNVIFELGYAAGTKKIKWLPITSGSIKKLPFDFITDYVVKYVRGNSTQLREDLKEPLKDLLNISESELKV